MKLILFFNKWNLILNNFINLNEFWDTLNKQSTQPRGLQKMGLLSNLGLFIGIDNYDKKKMLMLECINPESINIEIFPKWKGIDISIRKIEKEQSAITLKLMNDKTLDIFNSLIVDIISKLETIIPLKESINKKNELILDLFISCIGKWSEFFKKFKLNVLSEENQMGLFGELYFIKNNLMRIINLPKIIDCWHGPEKSHQDFSFKNGNIEVKTTVRKEHKKVYINSEKQLDNSGLPNLYLYCISLNSDKNNGDSLFDIVQDVRLELETNYQVLNLFNDKLNKLGFTDEHSKHYKTHKFIYKKEYLFRIEDEFPRIVDLPEGVGSVKYSLVISSCLTYKKEIIPSLERLINEI